MSKLIRMDRTGHTTLAEWSRTDLEGRERAIAALERELEQGMVASVSKPDGTAEVTRMIPQDAELIVLRRPIAGG
ncbi:hypothetical protein BH10ACT11_BH10ACT11_04060 [soil metagenome]